MTHELKITPIHFNYLILGAKTFEVRKNDRNYQVGDKLLLKEWNFTHYTGREVEVEVTHILNDPDYCKKGFVIMSIKL